MIYVFDEAQIENGLEALSAERRVLFACACAERLFPAYEWSASITGRGDPDYLREALDVAWSARAGLAPGDDTERRIEAVEKLVPDEDDPDWPGSIPLMENAAAAVVYALRTSRSGESREALYAALQLYEASDYLVQVGQPVGTYLEGEPPLPGASIADVFADVKVDATSMRSAAVADGHALLHAAKAILDR